MTFQNRLALSSYAHLVLLVLVLIGIAVITRINSDRMAEHIDDAADTTSLQRDIGTLREKSQAWLIDASTGGLPILHTGLDAVRRQIEHFGTLPPKAEGALITFGLTIDEAAALRKKAERQTAEIEKMMARLQWVIFGAEQAAIDLVKDKSVSDVEARRPIFTVGVLASQEAEIAAFLNMIAGDLDRGIISSQTMNAVKTLTKAIRKLNAFRGTEVEVVANALRDTLKGIQRRLTENGEGPASPGMSPALDQLIQQARARLLEAQAIALHMAASARDAAYAAVGASFAANERSADTAWVVKQYLELKIAIGQFLLAPTQQSANLAFNQIATLENAATVLSAGARSDAVLGKVRADMGPLDGELKAAIDAFMISASQLRTTRDHVRSLLDTVSTEALGIVERTKVEAAKGAAEAGTWSIVAVIGGILVAMTAGGFLSLRLLQPIGRLTECMTRLATGDLAIEIAEKDRHDEIGRMERALSVFRDNAAYVRDVKDDLQKALDLEREFSAQQRQFVSMVSHEFRTPLAIIDGIAYRIQRRFDRITPEKADESLGKIRNAVKRLIDLMESVLAAARMEDGKILCAPEPSRLAELLEDLVESFRDLHQDRLIETDIADLPEQVVLDPKLIRQVFANLLSNAIKYSPEQAPVFVRGWQEGSDSLSVSVTDRGYGIPKEEIDRLFERFFRASTSTGIAGSGIGLHLSHYLVDLHGGNIDVQSELGVGTTFTVCLPILSNSSFEQEAPPVESIKTFDPIAIA